MPNKKSKENVFKGFAFLIGSILSKDKTTQKKLLVEGIKTLIQEPTVIKKETDNNIIDIEYQEVKDEPKERSE